jgi:hypothetical protein
MTAAEGSRRLRFAARLAHATAIIGGLRIRIVLSFGASPLRELPLG